jgi:competence protein ComEC
MIPGVLVVSITAGILWCDAGHRLAGYLIAPWLFLSVGSSCALISRIRNDSPAAFGRPAGFRTLCLLGMICAAGLAFFAGFECLDRELSRSRLDAERAHRVTREAVRIAEARVRSRRSGRFGDEVELVAVRAIDGESVLPLSLILRLGQQTASGVEALPSRADRLLWPGVRVRVALRISPLRSPRNPGTPDREHHAARRGQAARARLVKPNWVLALSGDSFDDRGVADRLTEGLAAWRERVGARLAQEGRSGALVRALGLGDRSGMDRETREAFRRLGLSHLLAVSGLHVGFVAGLAGWLFLRASSWIFRPGGKIQPFDWSLGVACLAAVLYALVTVTGTGTGAGISVERAVLLFGLCAIVRLCLQTIRPGAAMASVAAGILLMDPAALFDVGAQLSFGACVALIVGGIWKNGANAGDPGPPARRDRGWGDRISQAAFETFRASLVISLATAPLLVQHGMPLAVLAPIVNVIAIPWLGMVVLPAALLAVLFAGALPASALSALLLPARGLEGSVVWAAMRLPEKMEYALLPLPILVLLIGVGVFWLRRGEWRKAAVVWVGISLLGSTPGLRRDFPAEEPRVVFFEVGQGDAALVQGRDAVLLIDTGSGPADGSGGAALVRGLRAVGVGSIDVLAVTHADLDHRAGASRVLTSFPVEELWLPISATEDRRLLALSNDARARGTRVRWLAADARETDRGDLEIDVLWPPPGSSSKARSRNESSLVLRVVVEGMAFLFTADIGTGVEQELLASSGPLLANVLKVAHHGSRRSSSAAFLEAVSATAVVVSAPCDPTRGLPNSTTLDRLRRSGASLWWTGRDGAVVAARDEAGRIVLKGWGPSRLCLRP